MSEQSTTGEQEVVKRRPLDKVVTANLGGLRFKNASSEMNAWRAAMWAGMVKRLRDERELGRFPIVMVSADEELSMRTSRLVSDLLQSPVCYAFHPENLGLYLGEMAGMNQPCRVFYGVTPNALAGGQTLAMLAAFNDAETWLAAKRLPTREGGWVDARVPTAQAGLLVLMGVGLTVPDAWKDDAVLIEVETVKSAFA